MSIRFKQHNKKQYRRSFSSRKCKSYSNSISSDIRFKHELRKLYRKYLMVNNEGEHLEQLLKIKQTKFAALYKKTAGPCYPLLDNDWLDSGVYFEPDKTPKHMSQGYLVKDHLRNDHLMKMPNLCCRESSEVESIMEGWEEERAEEKKDTEDDLQLVEQFKKPFAKRGDSNKALKYFRFNRRRISPIPEESENDDGASNTRTNWTAGSTEVYRTITKISGKPRNFVMRPINPDLNEQTKDAQMKDTQTKDAQRKDIHTKHALTKDTQTKPNAEMQVKRVRIVESSCSTLENIAKQIQPEVITANFYNAAMRENITQELRVTLVAPDDSPRLAGSKNRAQIATDSSQPNGADVNNMKPTKSHRCHIETIRRWLLRPFRWRSRASAKSKSQIHAIINKTYFVRWKKTSPSNDYLNGFGVKPVVVEELPKLRRCRSANF